MDRPLGYEPSTLGSTPGGRTLDANSNSFSFDCKSKKLENTSSLKKYDIIFICECSSVG